MPLAVLKQDGRSLTKQFRLHEGQERVWNSEARFVLMIAGTQSGKTSFGPIWCAREVARHPGGRGMVIGPTYSVLEREALENYVAAFDGTDWQGTLNGSKLIYTHPEGTRVHFKSAEKPNLLEGGHFDWIWMDEAGQYKYGVWNALRARLSIGQGRVLATTTPYAMNWLWSEWYKKWQQGDERFDVINFASTQNPVFPQEEFEEAQRDLAPEVFERRYLGRFTQMAGLVYPEGLNSLMDRMAMPEGWETWDRYGGIDFGYHNAFVILNAVRSPDDVVYVHSEHYRAEALLAFHAKRLIKDTRYYADPSAKQDIEELKNIITQGDIPGIRIKSAINDVGPGIEKVRARIRSGRLKVTRNCRHTIEELEGYHYRDTEEKAGDERPVKEDDHCMDALRYLVMGIDGAGGHGVWVA